jgi:calcineurin-like phosphoesterase family protein
MRRVLQRVSGVAIVTTLLTAPAAVHAAPLAFPTAGPVVRVELPETETASASTTTPLRAKTVTIAAAGDIACDPRSGLFNGGRGSGRWCRASAVEKVIQAADPDAVLPLGDEQYEAGRLKAFRRSYDKSWGDQLPRTYPVPGNHEYEASRRAYGYFTYFGSHSGPNEHGWYSVELGSWRLIAINSNCWAVGGCAGGSAQYRWLRHLLANRPSTCSLAFMHHPLVSSGPHGDDESGARPLWKLLYRYGVDVALVGHDHIYERFAPVNAYGVKDKRHGIREFVVGTGGAMHYGIDRVHRYSQVHNTRTFGALRMTLRSGAYDWKFLPAAGGSFTDSGTARCHGAP